MKTPFMRPKSINRLLPSQLWLFLSFAISLGLFLVVRPSSGSLGFWTLLALILIPGSLYMWKSREDAKGSKAAWAVWNRRLQSFADINDVEDDGHLYEWFDASEWERIFSELERMPKGSRSLKQAISVVDPDSTKQNP
jgi:hypothetical protein